MLVWGKPGPKTPLRVNIGLFQSSGNGLSSRRLGGGWGTLRLWQFPTDIKTLWMTLLIAQIQSPRIGRDQLMRGPAMPPCLKAVQRIFQRGIAWMKISQTGHHGWRLRLETHRCVNAVSLHLEQDMGRVRGGEKTVGEIR